MSLPSGPFAPARPPAGATAYVTGAAEVEDCCDALSAQGYLVITSPTEDPRAGLHKVLACDFVVVVRGWPFDTSANLEIQVARALKLPVLDCSGLDPVWLP